LIAPAPSTARLPAGLAVLLVGFDAGTIRQLEGRLAGEVLTAEDADGVCELLAGRQVTVLGLGGEIEGPAARRLLGTVIARHPDPARRHVVLAASQPELFQDLVARDQLYYLTAKPPPVDDVLSILESAVERYRSTVSPEQVAAHEAERPDDARRLLELTHQLAGQVEIGRAAGLTAETARELVAAERAHCLIYDPATETLWTRPAAGGEERRESAAAGLVSFVVRTARTVQLESVGEDPRYDPEADNDGGPADDRLLAVPVTSSVGLGEPRVLAVLLALRAAARPPFTPRDRDRLQWLAGQVAPIFSRFALQAELDAAPSKPGQAPEAQIFRQEAVEHHLRGFTGQGDVLRISPRWIHWTYRLLLAVFVAALAYVTVGSIHEWSTGVAVVRLEGRTEITATVAGTVTSVAVEPGQRVAAGQLLASLYGAQEAAELERIEREFELELVNRLRQPADPAIARTLGALRGQKQLAAARLEERSIRAPHGGLVSDLRIQTGQHLSPGHVVLTLVGEDTDLNLVAMFPGQYLPLIEPGMPLRFEPHGYRYAYQHLRVERVGDEVVGPAEARRFLGAGIGDAVTLSGPVVFVHAELPATTFESDGRIYRYHDGIQGTAEVRVRSESILTTLLPGLKALSNDSDG
jgi:membrane fusion protein (multidrug efflux system)